VIKFSSCSIRIGLAFVGEPIGVRATAETDVYEVFYGHQAVGQFNLNGSAREGRKTLAMSRLRRVAND
jgi:hypothetical protein